MNINDAMCICFKNKLIVYPIIEKPGWKVEVNDQKNKKITIYKKIIKSSKDLNEAITKTYIFWAKKLI